MRILLVGPTALDSKGNPIKQRKLHLPGLTLPMLAAVTPQHCELRLVNETVEDIPFDERWDLVGITGMGSGIVRAWQIADEFKRRGTTVVIGGIAASLLGPDLSLAHADAVVIGEAEEIWPELINDFENNRLKLMYRMQRPPPIEKLPLPRYELMNRSKLGFWRPVQATRGCPFTCNYCSITAFFEATYRKRPVAEVVRDVRAAKQSGTRYIAFIDDNIGVDFKYCTELWEALIPEKIIWISQCSLHIAERPEMLRLARQSGCRLLSFGIETTSPESLKAVDKEWNRPERYREAVATIRRHGIDVSTEMIIGLDGDDASVFQRTFDFILDNQISVPRVHIMTPIPGTPLYKELKQEGRIVSEDLSRFSGGQVIYRPLHLKADELQAGYWKLYENLFSWRAIKRRIAGNRASLGPYMRAFVLGVNLHYRNHILNRICPGIV
ncbi:MAG: B12-binding domain-containing radical SAM protein [Acidobacteria bacterium]|nr:B12-binding domain-containing radical SAM protein [Acidobacteriota bacterium]